MAFRGGGFAGALALVALLPAAASAMHASSPAPWPKPGGSGTLTFALSASAGVLEGVAHERAYTTVGGASYKLSELNWDLKDLPVAGLQGSVGFGDRVQVNLGWWGGLSKGGGRMVDRDWLYEPAYPSGLVPSGPVTDDLWTDRSIHPDLSVDKVLLLDVNLAVRALTVGRVALCGILGYSSDVLSWTARGGSYEYSNAGFRDAVGSFPAGLPVIEYRQEYTVGYAGIGLDGDWGRLRVHGYLLGGGVKAHDRDHHPLRDLLFLGDFGVGAYLGAGATGTFFFTPGIFAALGVEYQRIGEIRGDVTVVEPSSTWFSPGSGAVAMHAWMTSLSLGCRF